MAVAQLGLPLPLHRNQQLFADYYLNVLLPQREDWRLLVAEAAPTLAALRAIYAAFTPSTNEAQTEDGLIKPVLLALGHTFEVQAALKTPDGTKKPDYVFYTDQTALKAHKDQTLTETLLTRDILAVGDAKFWDRPLDLALQSKGVDLFNNKNPSYQIAFYMQHSGAEWGLLTNGRLWRLFHKASAYKQNCFYEVNLPELLEQPDPAAFLYFYAFFRRAAFDEHPLGLRALLQASTDFARGIGEHLKQQVYAALRHVAQGFLDYTPNGLQRDPATLKTIYDHSLLVLYRLLFIFYAEARELLPLRDSSQYRESYSLEALKREVALRLDGGKYLLPSTNMYWSRLRMLFEMINAGAEPLQVATFNGGLFDPQRYPFLETRSIGDAQLLQALDKLARVDRQFIDYRDLAERHLGTIYEGLLEYHLEAIAPTGGWSVDLLNAKGERKATGSYYTPDYIVKYIVDQTVGPALQRAIAGKHEAAAQVRAILAVNVCDPAMGSGHFLVEATEYIARFLVALAVPPETDTHGEADLAYWKRRVAQSCIYGVDLNPLAVDLAKLSLWLVTVAKDKPLSFLDHHLRCGNALVGARLADLETRPLTADRRRPAADHTRKVVAVQSSLLDDAAFRLSMSSAVDSMWLIEATAGQTVAEVKEQAQIYTALRAILTERYGRLANLTTAQAFGVAVPDDQHKALTDYATGRNLTVLPQMVALLEQADALAAQRAFFHWELEFPEVFFDHHGASLGEAAGFDAVVGNPPYVRQEQLGFFKPYFQMAYAETYSGTADLFVYFFHQGVKLLRQGGKLGYISSNSWLQTNYAEPLRRFMREQTTLEHLIDLGNNRTFAEAPDVCPSILVSNKTAPTEAHRFLAVAFQQGEAPELTPSRLAAKAVAILQHDQPDTGWQLETDAMRLVFRKLMAGGKA
ncbi:MAG: N-6 DNA methylase, partial [Chloroflexales bacterium]